MLVKNGTPSVRRGMTAALTAIGADLGQIDGAVLIVRKNGGEIETRWFDTPENPFGAGEVSSEIDYAASLRDSGFEGQDSDDSGDNEGGGNGFDGGEGNGFDGDGEDGDGEGGEGD